MIVIGLWLLILAVPLWGLGKTVVGLVRRRKRAIFGGLALICGSIAIEGYLLGAGAVAMAANESEHGADSSPSPACRQALGERASYIVGHEAGYLPLRFDCKLDNGTTVSAGVVARGTNAVVLIATLATAGLTLAAKSAGARGRSDGASDPYRESAPA